MKKGIVQKLDGLFWLWKNRKTIFPILRYEVGTRYYSSKYDLLVLEAKIKSLAVKHIDLPELLEKEKIRGGGARVL